MNVSKSVKLGIGFSVFCVAITSVNAKSNDAGNASIDFNLRYESVEQDNAKKDADALTLRTRLNYQYEVNQSLTAVIEFEDSRALELDDYNDMLGNNPEYSVIADPETTELDQGFLQYQHKQFTAKIGRQVIAIDNQRFVGHVGWRQDRQTFDAVSVSYAPTTDITFNYNYIDKRNRIFAEDKDLRAKDHLLNATYTTSLGKFSGYAYLLEVDNNTNNSLDTYGLSYSGNNKIADHKLFYRAEFASQKSQSSGDEFDSNYLALEAGIDFSLFTAKVGLESLGSDDGNYGFSTPLATLHKFNGFADQFLTTPTQGLDDLYLSLSGKILGGSWLLVYHQFDANESNENIDDFGSEINAVFTKSFAKYYSAGFKLAAYSAGDDATGIVDTDKVWLWVSAKF